MVYHCQDLGISTSNWLRQISLVARPIRSTTQIRVVTCHQYGISPFNHPRDLKSGVPWGQSTRKPGLTLQNVGCFLRLPVLGNSLWIRPKPSKFTMYLKPSFLLWLVSHTCISAVDIRSLMTPFCCRDVHCADGNMCNICTHSRRTGFQVCWTAATEECQSQCLR